jgi:hypothetical protein
MSGQEDSPLLLDVVGIGSGNVHADRSGAELNLKLASGDEVRLKIDRANLERLVLSFGNLLTKLEQFFPRGGVVPGETVEVHPVFADRVLAGGAPNGQLAVLFESQTGLSQAIAMDRRVAQHLVELLVDELKNPTRPDDHPRRN